MFGRSNPSSTAESSFFYLLMAATCFRRTGCTRHPNADSALRDIGREYLAKAGPDARVFTVGPR
ncbi:MAG TPA: hypothetical protein VNO18_08530 [Xanthobacteraceae bacterium]|jgi:hypothetical protein|nr:hypothetical protein [Xanthobacteraceae bacterium]